MEAADDSFSGTLPSGLNCPDKGLSPRSRGEENEAPEPGRGERSLCLKPQNIKRELSQRDSGEQGARSGSATETGLDMPRQRPAGEWHRATSSPSVANFWRWCPPRQIAAVDQVRFC